MESTVSFSGLVILFLTFHRLTAENVTQESQGAPNSTIVEFLPPLRQVVGAIELNQSSKTECTLNKYVVPFTLPDGYDKVEIPTTRDPNTCKFEKIPVRVGIRLRNIRGVNELTEEVTMEVDLVVAWYDLVLGEHLAGKTKEDFILDRGVEYIPLEASFINKIWQPDVFFSRTVSVTRPGLHTSRSDFKSSRLRLYPGGKVEYSSRLIVTLYCPMNFQYFPADTQICHVRLRSYAFTNEDIQLDWYPTKDIKKSGDGEIIKKELAYFYNRDHPNYDIFLHTVMKFEKNESDARNDEEEFTYLAFQLSIRRKLTYHITQTYIPSAFLIVITWLTFFIPLSALEARIGVAMTTLLTMTNNFAGIRSLTPNVSYLKAIDIYMMACISIVFVTLFEFTFLFWIRKGRSEHLESRISLMKKIPSIDENGQPMEASTQNMLNQAIFIQLRNYIEVYGFLITIIGFIFFNLIYWPWILFASKYYFADIDFSYNDP